MNKSILVIDTPNSCSECELYFRNYCIPIFKHLDDTSKIDKRCPLQDTTELLEIIKEVSSIDEVTVYDSYGNDYDIYCNLEAEIGDKLDILYKALGGKVNE